MAPVLQQTALTFDETLSVATSGFDRIVFQRRPSPELRSRTVPLIFERGLPDRRTPRTVFRDTLRSRAISRIVLP